MKLNGTLATALFYSLLAPICIPLAAQQAIVGSPGTISRPTPIIGFNANGHFAAANWTQQSFVDSTVLLNAEIFRYPGGTISNYWDWQTGWKQPPAPPAVPPLSVRPEEFQVGLNATHAEGLFVLNYRNSDINFQMAGLRHIDSLGMGINYVEIGNEHNIRSIADSFQFVYPTTYGQDCKVWADSIKAEWPNAKICLVGGASGQNPEWHDSILLFNPDIDAFAMHVYLGANNADLVFDVKRALSIPFASLVNRFTGGKFDVLPSDIDVWVTEYNLWETGPPANASAPTLAETWTHALYVSMMNHFFLTQPKITMIINHSLASINPYYQSISGIDHHITANGIAMRLLLDVSKGTDTAEQIIFSPSPTITYGLNSFDKLIGWKFIEGSTENGFICNFSNDTFSLSLASVFSQAMQIAQYKADTNFVVSGLSSLNKMESISTNVVVIYPFSMTQITPADVSEIGREVLATKPELLLFPNPGKDAITVKMGEAVNNAVITIFNALGKEVLTYNNVSGTSISINTTSLHKGTYVIRIIDEGQNCSAKFVVE